MIYIENKKYVIVKDDEILCNKTNGHVFAKINNLGKKNIMIYSSYGKAYGVILRCKYAKYGARVIEIKETISGD